jgi:small subunit ribosomal protein S7
MRGKSAPVRALKPDYKYNSIEIARLINKVMISGKKKVAEYNVYKALEKLEEMAGVPALEAFQVAIGNVKPKVEVKAKRVGGANYQIPTPVRDTRQYALAYRWIINSARDKRTNTEFYVTLAEELADAYKMVGSAVKKKEEMHRMAEANKAFAHLAW